MFVFKVVTTVFVTLIAVGFMWAGFGKPTDKSTKLGCGVIDAVLAMAILAMWG